MKYRKIPFMSSKGSLMSGLAPLTTSKGFGPQFPGSSMLGAVPATTTVIMRPQPNAPAGFPGFFSWLAATQPTMYAYAKAALPAYVTQAEGHRTGGATLSGLGIVKRPPTPKGSFSESGFFGEESASNANGIQNARTMPEAYTLSGFSESGFFGEESASNANGLMNARTMPDALGMYMAGLGDDGTDDSDILTPDLTTIDPGVISVPLPTVSIPDTAAETASVGTPPSPSAGAVASIVSTLTAAAPAILSDVNSQTIFNAQLARAQAGLPPLNTAAYGIGTTLSSLASSPIALLGIAAVVGLLLMSGKK